MPYMLHKKFILLFSFLFMTVLCSAQSKKVWIELADEAYAKRDYANAAIYYAKVLDDTTVLRNYVLPYEPQLVNLKMPSLLKQKADPTYFDLRVTE